MSLNSCLRSLGRDLFADEDVARVQELFDANKADGMQPKEAAASAIRTVLNDLGDEGKRYQQAAPTNLPQGGFYSALLSTIRTNTSSPRKGTAQQWKAWLNGRQSAGEFKKSERDWLGVDAWLDGREITTREELAAFVEANQVQVQNVVLGEDEPVKFDTYVLPGGKNYRELLLTLPVAVDEEREAISRKAAEEGLTSEEEYAIYNRPLPAQFKSSHFDQPNVLAHVRFNERADADGKRVLFLEEIQSDWHQEGRKKGYRASGQARIAVSAVEKPGYWEVTDGNGNFVSNVSWADGGVSAETAIAEANRRLREAPERTGRGYDSVPNAPFKATDEWAMLAFKRMVRYAVDNGFDSIAWTTGEQQADRYDLSKQVDSIDYRKTRHGFDVYANKNGTQILARHGLGESELADLVGKDVAEKIVNGEGVDSEARTKRLSGLDLKVGSAGMRGFYDQILPSAVNKWAKKFGGKIERITIDVQGRPERNEGTNQRVEYVGPAHTAASVAAATSRYATSAESNVSVERQLHDIANAIRDGADYAAAIVEHGSISAALALGGYLQPLATVPATQPSLTITDAMRDAVKAGMPLFSRGEQGGIQGETVVTDAELLVRLSQASDQSTMLHELAHVFLEMERRLAAKYGLTDQHQTMLEILGVKSFDEISTAQHELWARTWESYYLEGKAPSIRLREAFAAFSRWLARIYQGAKATWLKGQALPLTPEVRDVLDRLLATQAELEEAKASPEYLPLFRSKEQAGMTDKEWEDYNKAKARRDARAQVSLEDKVLKAVRDARTTEWKEEHRVLKDDERQRLLATPTFAAIAGLRDVKLDTAAVKKVLGVDKLPTGRLLGLVSSSSEVSPEDVWEAYGFDSARQMLESIQNTMSLDELADNAATRAMLEKHGDVLNDGTIEFEAQQAYHNDAQAEVLLRELAALKRATKAKREPDFNLVEIAAQAEQTIASMAVGEIKPERYHRAEVRAAQKAATAKSPEEARAAKAQQLVNHYLFRAATKARKDYLKYRAYVSKRQRQEYNTADVHPDYAAAIQQYAKLYDVADKRERDAHAVAATTWFETQLLERTDFAVADMQLAEVLATRRAQRAAGEVPSTVFYPPRFEELTLEEARGVYEQLRHLRWVGGREGDIKKAEWKAEVDGMLAKVAGDPKAPVGRDTHTQSSRKAWDEVRHFGDSLLTLRNMIRVLDGGESGPFFSGVYQRLYDGQVTKRRLEREVNTRFDALTKGLKDLTIRKTEGTVITQRKADGNDWSLDEEERIMLAYYWGNEYSRSVVRQGYAATDSDVLAMLATLTKDQAALVNALWEVNDSVWPELASASHEVYGFVPTKTIALPFTVGSLNFSGGHGSIIYEYAPADVEVLEGDNPTFYTNGLAPGKASALFERKGSGGRRVQLSRDNFFRSLNDNMHFIAFGKIGRDMQQLLGNRKVKDAIATKHGIPFLRALNESVQGITTNRKERDWHAFVGAISRVLRRAATVGALGYSIRNTVQQLTSIPIVSEDLGAFNFFKSAVNFYSTGMTRHMAFVDSKSELMRSRSRLVNRESAEVLRELAMPLGKLGRAWHWYNKHAFTPQAVVDMSIAYPAWMSKYEQGIAEHGDERRAVMDADVLIGESVGSGDDLFLSNFYRSNRSEAVKSFTLMGSWANLYLNRIVRASKGGRQVVSPEVLIAAFVTPVMVATLSAAVVLDGPDDDESWAAWVASNYGQFALSWLPGIRDIWAYHKYRRTAEAPQAPLVELGAGAITAVETLLDEEKELELTMGGAFKTVSSVIPVAGAGNVNRVVDYIDARDTGAQPPAANPATATYQALVEGRDRDQ